MGVVYLKRGDTVVWPKVKCPVCRKKVSEKSLVVGHIYQTRDWAHFLYALNNYDRNCQLDHVLKEEFGLRYDFIFDNRDRLGFRLEPYILDDRQPRWRT
jgi:hypothetical protein